MQRKAFEHPTRVPWLMACLLAWAAGPVSAQEAKSIDDLFGGPPAPASKAPAAKPAPREGEAKSIDDLFGGPPPTPRPGAPAQPALQPAAPKAELADLGEAQPARPAVTGFFYNELAYTYAGTGHWSFFTNMLDLSTSGKRGALGFKLGARVSYDPVYAFSDYYNGAVKKDQRFEAMIREAYVDFGAGNLEFRIGRQQIVWGEVVGLFVADVVSAKDLRQFTVPDFDLIRIPQWAARAEYYLGDLHGEAVWIPSMTYNDIGKPGAEFYPVRVPAGIGIERESRPRGIGDSGYGLRLAYLRAGWDMSAFHYSANDLNAAFERLTPTLYRPIHKRIHQTGITLSKDLGPAVFKGEAVYTRGRLFSTADPADADGLVRQNTLDWLLSMEFSFPEDTRVNAQFFQRHFFNHDAHIGTDRTENGVSLLLSTKAFHPRIEPRLLLISSLNREDWSAQFKLDWRASGNWRYALGWDVFQGRPTGLFGRYNNNDRIYTEARYSF